MSLRLKVVTIFALTIYVLYAITCCILYYLKLSNNKLEDEKYSEKYTNDLKYNLENYKYQLNQLSLELASDREIYDILKNINSVNFSEISFDSHNDQFEEIYFFNLDNKLITTYNSKSAKFISLVLEEDILKYISSDSFNCVGDYNTKTEFIKNIDQVKLVNCSAVYENSIENNILGYILVSKNIEKTALVGYEKNIIQINYLQNTDKKLNIKSATQLDLGSEKINYNSKDNKLNIYYTITSKSKNPIFVIETVIARDYIDSSNNQFMILSFVLFIMCNIGIVLFYFATSQFIYKPIKSLVKEIDNILEDNDFSKKVVYTGTDELNKIAIVLNTILKRVNTLYQNVSMQSQSLEKKVEEIEKSNKILEDSKMAMINILEDQRELEDVLRIEKDRISSIMKAVGDGVVVVNESHEIIYINPAAEKLLEFNPGEVMGRKWDNVTTSLHKGQQVTEADRNFKKIFKYGTINTISLDDDYSYKTKSNKVIPVAVIHSPLINSEKNVTGVVIVFRDMTQEKYSKTIIEKAVVSRTREMEEEKARLNASINSMSLGFIMTSTTGEIITMNSAISVQFKIPRYTRFINDIDKNLGTVAGLSENVQKVLTSKIPITIECININNSFFRFQYAPIYINTVGKREVIGVVIIVEDITSTKLLERTRDEFFSIASHELRTPLTAIRGNTSMIKEYYPEILKNQDVGQMLDDIHKSSVRLIEIVNDFLDVSRLEQKRFEFKKETVNIFELTQETLKEFDGIIKERNLKLNIITENSFNTDCICDRNRMKQVLLNIIGNAIKFTQEGSVTVGIYDKDKNIEIHVHDTGQGISQDKQSLLFRKFQQAAENIITRDATRGTGLGLYISKLMIEGMGGDVYLVSSKANSGSTFGIMLPKKS